MTALCLLVVGSDWGRVFSCLPTRLKILDKSDLFFNNRGQRNAAKIGTSFLNMISFFSILKFTNWLAQLKQGNVIEGVWNNSKSLTINKNL